MRRRFIALQPDSGQWRFALAVGDHQQTTLLQTGVFEQNPAVPLADLLATRIGPLQLADRLACALPAQTAMIRWLEFPFTDPQKIAAASQPEMARQLPGSLDDRVSYQQVLGDNQVLAVAVAKAPLEELIEQFDDNREPLGYIGLLPFCCVAGFESQEDGLLLCAEQDEITLARYENSRLTDLRILPQTSPAEIDEIVRQAQLLAHSAQPVLDRLMLLGTTNDSELADTFRQTGFSVESPQFRTESGPVPAELSSTACLALAAANATARDLNLRTGQYKLKNDWQALKRRMGLAATLLIVSLLAVIVNGYLQYSQRAGELEQLEQQMVKLYQNEFPDEKLVAPPPLQLQSKFKDLQNKANQFSSASPGALKLLLTVSQSIDPELSVEVKDYLHSEEGLRLTGTTTDFDAVSRLLANLQQEKSFADVRILDSKQTVDGKEVDFQLQIQLRPEEDAR